MKNKNKYNFNNPMILIYYSNNEDTLKYTINKKTNENILSYIDKFFVEFKTSNGSYKLYTSTLTKEESKKKFPKQFCWECGTISNIFFPKYIESCGVVSSIINCEICYPFVKGFTTKRENFISAIRYIKYNSKKRFLRKYNKFKKYK